MWFVVDRGGTLCIACGGYKLIHINPHETGVNECGKEKNCYSRSK